jgi:pentapeptide MXKDX repeat protein
MRNLIIAACCAALVGSVSVASAQTTTPDAKADTSMKMKKKSTKKSAMKSGDTMSKDGTKDSK